MASKASKALAANKRRTVRKVRTTTKSASARVSTGCLESVLDFRATGTELVFRVHSGGCTEAKHFQLDVKRREGRAEITLTRLVPDNCKGEFPEGIEITFRYAAAGLDRADVIRLVNPIE